MSLRKSTQFFRDYPEYSKASNMKGLTIRNIKKCRKKVNISTTEQQRQRWLDRINKYEERLLNLNEELDEIRLKYKIVKANRCKHLRQCSIDEPQSSVYLHDQQ